MTHEELDTLWQKSVNESIKAGDSYARYRYAEYVAALVAAAEREACAKVCEIVWDSRAGLESGTAFECAAAIRARGET